MENSDRDILIPQTLKGTQSAASNTELHGLEPVSSEPEDEQQDEPEPDTQPESNQETPEESNSPPPLALIELRLQQLHSRRLLLLKSRCFRKKAEDKSGEDRKELTCEDTDELSELEVIEKELEDLGAKREELERQGNRITLDKDQLDLPSTVWKAEAVCGGIYTLPPAQPDQQDTSQEVETGPPAKTPSGPILPVHSLGNASDVTRCPSCEEIISTEIQSRVSEAMWLFCCLCSMVGCVAGCCLIPFFMAHLKKVDHHCPQCQAHIHTYKPF